MTKDGPQWKPWIKECQRFKKRETEGFWKDYKALEMHIAKLREIGPKDSAKYLYPEALYYLRGLHEYLDKAKLVSESVKLPIKTPQD